MTIECIACHVELLAVDMAWIISKCGDVQFTVAFCHACAEVEADDVLIELLGTADDLPVRRA